MFGVGNASIWVVEEGGQSVQLLKTGMVALHVDKEVHAHGNGGEESHNGTGGLDVVLQLSLGKWSLGVGLVALSDGAKGWEESHAGLLGDLSLLSGLDGHGVQGGVVGSTHGGLGWHLDGLGLLSGSIAD